MLKKDVQHIRVGIFVFLALTVGAFIIFMIGSERRVFESHYILKAKFNDISGLRVGATIQLAGVNVGFVDDIRFPDDLVKKEIEVLLGIAKSYQDRIREDSVATINTQGLLGDKFIFVSIGSAEKPVIPDDGIIKTKEVIGLFDLAEKGGEIIEDLKKAAKSLSRVLGDVSDTGDLKSAMTSLKNMLQQAEKGKGLIHALIYDPQGQQIVRDAAAAMRSLRHALGDGQRGQFKSAAHSIGNIAQNLSEITEKINRGEGTLGGIINDPTIYNDIRSIFGKVNRNALFKAVVRATLKENEKSVLK